MKVLSTALLAFALGFGATAAQANSNYPNKAVHLEVGFAPGGPTDIIARLAAQHLGDDLGQSFVVENKAGAGGNIATNNVTRARPDGYTGLVASINITINPFMTEGLRPESRDLKPVKILANAPTVLVVRDSFPAKDFPGFLKEVKDNPEKYSSAAHGASPLLATTLFYQKTGAKIIPVPYKGAAPAMIDLMAGHVDLSFATLGSVMPHINSGKLRILAVAAPERLASMPDVPTFAEMGLKEFSFDSWVGLFMPPGTPDEVISVLERSLDKLVASDSYRAQIADAGFSPLPSDPASFAAIIDKELALYEELVKATRAAAEGK